MTQTMLLEKNYLLLFARTQKNTTKETAVNQLIRVTAVEPQCRNKRQRPAGDGVSSLFQYMFFPERDNAAL